MANQALGPLIKIFWEADFSLDDLFEDFKRVIMHKGASAYKHLVNEYAEGVPVNWLAMPFIHDNLRCKVFWSATNCVSPLIVSHPLNEAKV